MRRGVATTLASSIARAKTESGDASLSYLLRDALGRPIANAAVPHERAVRVAAGVDGYDIGVRLPAAAGRYVIVIEASDGKRVARRELPLTVR